MGLGSVLQPVMQQAITNLSFGAPALRRAMFGRRDGEVGLEKD